MTDYQFILADLILDVGTLPPFIIKINNRDTYLYLKQQLDTSLVAFSTGSIKYHMQQEFKLNVIFHAPAPGESAFYFEFPDQESMTEFVLKTGHSV